MSATITGSLPGMSDGQRIGQRAVACFWANKPDTWHPTDLSGDLDFGRDFNIATREGSQMRDNFIVQLKGAESPVKSVGGDFYSIGLKASTLRGYMRDGIPVMLVFADMSVDLKSNKNCPLFYVWVADALAERGIHGVPDSEGEIILRVPTANALNETSDLNEDVESRARLSAVGPRLFADLSRSRPDATRVDSTALIERMAVGLAARDVSLMDSLAQDIETPWPDQAPGTVPWFLREAANCLAAGDVPLAFKRLDECEALLAAAKDIDWAEFWFQKARALLLDGQTAASDAAFEAAMRKHGGSKYLVAWAESQMRSRHRLDDPVSMPDLLDKLIGGDDEVLCIRARILAAEGRYDEALATATSFEGPQSFIARAIIHTMQSQHDEALESCDSGLRLADMSRSGRQLLSIMRARATFNKALGPEEAARRSQIIPTAGVLGMDAALMRQAWEDAAAAFDVLRLHGWPSNVDFVADIFGAIASILERQDEAYPLLSQAAAARPHLLNLQSALESIAAQLGEFDRALEANAKQQGSVARLRRVGLLHSAGRHPECVMAFESALPDVDRSVSFFGEVCALAIISARKLVRPELEEAWGQALSESDRWTGYREVIAFVIAANANPLNRDDALRELRGQFDALGQPHVIGTHLVHSLDPSDKVQAASVLQVADALRTQKPLHLETELRACMAATTLRDWPALLALVEACLARFPDHPRLRALRALGLDGVGETANARAELSDMLEKGVVDEIASKAFVNIAIRCGFLNEAVPVAERLASVAASKAQKLISLRLLFGLTLALDPSGARAGKIALEYGDAVDRGIEQEEGAFLIMVITAGLRANADPVGIRRGEVDARFDRFFEAWPDSRLLKRADASGLAAAGDLRAILKKLGISERYTQALTKHENMLQHGSVAIPFAMRPRLALGMVHDVVHLWEVNRRSKADDQKFHFTMQATEAERLTASDLLEKMPLLDITALLDVHHLGLFDELFYFFPKVAIGKETLTQLSELSHPIAGSPCAPICSDMLGKLKAFLPQIEQPEARGSGELPKVEEELTQLASLGRYRVYFDDQIMRALCDAEKGKSRGMTTLDLIYALEERGRVDMERASGLVLSLITWHIGVVVEDRHMLSTIPAAVTQADISAGFDVLSRDANFLAMFNAIWNIRKPYVDVRNHAAQLFRRLIEAKDSASQTRVAAALAGFWFIKAKLRADAPADPLRVAAELTLAMLLAPGRESGISAPKILDIFKGLVALHFGSTMDEAKEANALRLLGALASDFDFSRRANPSRRRVSDLVIAGLRPGTSDDAFEQGAAARDFDRHIQAEKDA